DPLLYTGGGRTELTLDLLFDISIAGSSISTADVRALTRPLWEMAESQRAGSLDDVRSGRPPLVTFVWGKAWNIPGWVTAVGEKLEFFTADGAPRRSWLRMRLLRVDQSAARRQVARPLPSPPAPVSSASLMAAARLPAERAVGVAAEDVQVHEVIGGGSQS